MQTKIWPDFSIFPSGQVVCSKGAALAVEDLDGAAGILEEEERDPPAQQQQHQQHPPAQQRQRTHQTYRNGGDLEDKQLHQHRHRWYPDEQHLYRC